MEIRRRGLPVGVFLSSAVLPPALLSGKGGAGEQSFVLDTESRSLAGDAAYNRLVSELEKIPFSAFSRIIKKVDSTLRGNIGNETKALDRLLKPELIVFAPALPDLGRVTVNRIQCLNDEGGGETPLCQTEFAGDPAAPVKNDNIQKIMEEAFPDETVIHTGLDAVRNGSFAPEGSRIFSFDAMLNSDLEAIVRAVLAKGKLVLWVGSSGLANSLLGIDMPVPPALAIVASLSAVSRRQAHYAEKRGVSAVKIPLYAIIERKTDYADIANNAAAVLGKGKDLLLLPSSVYSEEERHKTEESARRAGLRESDLGCFIKKAMGQIAALILERTKVSGIFLSGGDTALGCIESLGAGGTYIDGEAALGMPVLRIKGGNHDGLKVITKAGAFGKEDAIFYALRKLRER